MNRGKFVILFIAVVLIQVLLLNNVQFSGYVNPFVYVLFILILPVNTQKYLLLLLGFILGITIDVFSNTPGIHASATVFLAFIRPALINPSRMDESERFSLPTIGNFGFGWFLRNAIFLIFAHHLFLFFIEVFSFAGFLHTLLRSFLSSVFTIILVVISQFIVFRR